MLSIEALSAGYGEVRVLRDVNLEVGVGEVVALLGANGAGKTTLLRTALGILSPLAGRIVFDGEVLNDLPVHGIVERG